MHWLARKPRGDAYVAATLEVLIEDPSLFDTTLDPRVALYRTFLGLWNSVDLNLKPEVVAGHPTVVDRKLESITPLPRQAFLLCAVEGFSPHEAATILGVDRDDVDRLVDTAGREIAAQVATDVLIIEDEPMIAMDIESIVEGLGHRVTGVARTHGEALKAVRDKQPGLVLADIQLADGSSGLDAVNEILGTFDVPVIFITAYPERLLDRRAARAHLPHHQAVSARYGEGDRQPGSVLRAQRAVARSAAGRRVGSRLNVSSVIPPPSWGGRPA